jgi:CheY-like chemotaxis protein
MESMDTSQLFDTSGVDDDEERKLSPILSSEKSTIDLACSIESVASSSVCLIDDSNLVLILTCTLLERSGYVVQVARNGLDAVQLACNMLSCAYAAWKERKNREDVAVVPLPTVLMDLQMPVLGGIEAVKCIRITEKQLQSACNCNTLGNSSLIFSLPEMLLFCLFQLLMF